MTIPYRPETLDELLDLIGQAVFELDEALHCAEHEGDEDRDFSALTPVYRQLREELARLQQAVQAGTWPFGGGDLPIMALVQQHRRRLPMRGLIEVINEAQKRELE